MAKRLEGNRQPNPEEAAYNRNRFFLATASSFRNETTGTWDPWEIQAVAYRNPTLWPADNLGPDWGFCEFGQCQECGTAVRSNVKEGVCPVCGATVRMT